MRRRGVILPVILFVLILLGLFGAMFSFRVHSDVASVQAVGNRLQSRLAAEAGVEVVKMILRASRGDRSVWYQNPDAFHRILVWAHDTEAREAGTNDEIKEDMAYRFSIVADDPTEFEKYIRFGITDESSKLNLNAATADQLTKLLRQTLGSESEGGDGVDAKAIVDAIIDWRDSDSKPNGESTDTEADYYLNLDHPYRVRNAPYTSVEELLLVKGVTGRVLYGEDFDRNGLLTPNEDDADESFPPDNQDGVLGQGIYPYLTVFSYEKNTSSENLNKVYLFSDEGKLKKDLAAVFPDEPEKIEFIVAATRHGSGTGSPPQDGSQKPPTGDNENGAQGENGAQKPPEGVQSPVTPTAPQSPQRPGSTGPKPPKPLKKETTSSKQQVQDRPGNTGGGGGGGGRRGSAQQNNQNPPLDGVQAGPDEDAQNENSQDADSDQDSKGEGGGEENEDEESGKGDTSGGSTPIRSPAGLLRPRMSGPNEIPSPFTTEDLPFLMDRLTTVEPSEETQAKGLINVNTASATVLRCLDGLTEEQIGSIIAARDGLDPEIAKTPAWIMTEGIIEDLDAFDKVAPYLTGHGQQFTIESLGYADHMGMVTRLQVVVDMVGPIVTTVYYRDLSYLGGSFPIREEDKEQVRGR